VLNWKIAAPTATRLFASGHADVSRYGDRHVLVATLVLGCDGAQQVGSLLRAGTRI